MGRCSAYEAIVIDQPTLDTVHHDSGFRSRGRGRTARVVQQESTDRFVDPRKVEVWPDFLRDAFYP